jgi:hypothetical protein
MLLEKQRRRMRLALQMSITYRAWFGLLFYPISFLLLLDKVRDRSHTLLVKSTDNLMR